MAFFGWLNGVKYGEADPWAYYLRNCTSYAAWKINAVFSINIHGWGNASTFNTNALAAGYTDDSSPRQGDLAQWDATGPNPYGHVAYVLSVTNGIATYGENNYAGDGNFTNNYTSASNSQGAPSHWIHIKDLTTANTFPDRTNVASVNKGSDLILTTNQAGGGTAANVGVSTYASFLPQAQWWADSTVGWSGITPLVGDVNGDGKDDYVFMANNAPTGVMVYVALSTGTGFTGPALWWNGAGYGYGGIKLLLGDVNGDAKDDLMLVTSQPGGGSAAIVLKSNGTSFTAPTQWWADPTTGWTNITPLTGDINGDFKDDLVLVANNNNVGTNAYVLPSIGTSFPSSYTWWTGTGWGYSGIKANLGDMDGNGGADLVLTTNQAGGGSAMNVLRSTYVNFIGPVQWWADPTVGWSNITPFVADFNNLISPTNYLIDDYMFLANNNNTGTNAYVAMNNGNLTLQGPALWWQGNGWGYSGIKAAAN